MQTNILRILFIGDIVGKPGRDALKNKIDTLKDELKPDFTIINAENAAGGFGINKKVYDELDSFGDAFTMGNHTWDKKEIFREINNMPKLIRPLNIPNALPGAGYRKFNVKNTDILVANLLGRIFMNPADNPFEAVDDLIDKNEAASVIKIIDFHAEATSEKEAMGWYCDGRVTAVVGTHTHVQTADERILTDGTAYISDVGMSGSNDGVLGFNAEEALDRFLYYIPKKLNVCKKDKRINGCIIDCDTISGKALNIERVNISAEN